MRKCKTCGIIGHPHKDFYPTSYRTLCKRCRPALRELSFEKALVSKPKHITFCDLIKLRNRINEKEKLRDFKIQQLKWQIKHRLKNRKCTTCGIKFNHAGLKEYKRKYLKCDDCFKIMQKSWANLWTKEHKRKYYSQYVKERSKIDPMFKIRINTRNLIRLYLKNKGYTKKSKTQEILGCDFETFKKHIERQFKKGMTWDNYSEWHLDHIYPVSLAKEEQHLIELNHYTNFRPMWATDNISKGNKIVEHQIKMPI